MTDGKSLELEFPKKKVSVLHDLLKLLKLGVLAKLLQYRLLSIHNQFEGFFDGERFP